MDAFVDCFLLIGIAKMQNIIQVIEKIGFD